MNTLQVSLSLSPPLVHVTDTSPPLTNRRSPILLPSTSTPSFNHHPNSTITKWKLQAEARGFGRSTPVTISEEKRRNDKKKLSNRRKGNDEDDEIEQEVWDRMLKRILVSVGTPVATGLGLVCILNVLDDNHILVVPKWLTLLLTLLSFGTSSFGIVYGTLSTSMKKDTEGTFLGWEQVEKNWPELWKEEDESKRFDDDDDDDDDE